MNISSRVLKTLALILIVAFMGAYVMPKSWKEQIPFSSIRENLLAKKPNFGLDLVGGRQFDFLVDLSEVEKRNADNDPDNDRDPATVVESIGEVLRGRIDPTATRELNIYSADYNEERHVIVEITSDLDNETTLDALQQVIDLKFKERQDKNVTDEEKAALRAKADEFLKTITPETFENQGKIRQKDDNVTFTPEKTYWNDEVTSSFPEDHEQIWNAAPESVFPKILERKITSLKQNANGGYEAVENTENVVMKVLKKEMATREQKEKGEDFEAVKKEVSERSDMVSAKSSTPEGENGVAVTLDNKDVTVKPSTESETTTFPSLLSVPEVYQGALLNLDEGKISDVLETDTEYAIFRIVPAEPNQIETHVSGIYVLKSTKDTRAKIDAIKERLSEKTTTTQEEKLTVSEIVFAIDVSGWKDTGLGGLQFKRARVGSDPNTKRPLVEILFNDEGSKLFEDVSGRNIGKQVAIFVGGVLISAPTIQEKISGGAAVITLGISNFTEARKQAVELARELNGGSTPAPFVEKGQFKIGATLGSEALQKSLQAGMLGFLFLSIFMIFFYRYLGFIAVLALGFYSIFIVFLLQASLSFGLAAVLGVVVFTTSMYSFSSLEKNEFLSLFIALILAIMVTFIAHSPMVLTLAGVSGILLSVGMAVDANILIFERIKEELRNGRSFSAASAIGFERAWSSVRDSNLSSLITCCILWIFGSAVIKGFAVALAMGIVISMLTAITVTRSLMSIMLGKRISEMKKFLIYGTEEK
ncbi:MMPL family transporter [Candidatus Peregrinibacteria bacterium]|nr:MMPL family transporter [Candidatus Peregrinibacteria bacterium]